MIYETLFAKKGEKNRQTLQGPLACCKALGHPEKAYPCVHVAGTNGKGSVATKIAKVLELSGFKVGLFTSPHLFSYTERIVVNGQPISEEKAQRVLAELIALTDSMTPPSGFFDLTTYLAFLHFRDENVDIAVFEAGIGGLLDTTNVITPEVSVITSIAMDHADVLGSTLEEIAFQKAGIIKPGVPVVIGPKARFSVIEEKADTLYSAPEKAGFYDLENQEIARLALQVLGWSMPSSAWEGLQSRPRGRFERIGDVIFDVAHNPDGIAHLIEALDLYYPKTPVSFIVGMSQDKDMHASLALLAKRAKRIFCVQGMTPKAAPPKELRRMLQGLGFVRAYDHLTIAEILGVSHKERDEMLVVCGSFYVMKEAYESLLGAAVSAEHPPLCLR